MRRKNKTAEKLTSGDSQSGKLVFGNVETGVIVGGNAQVVPNSRFELKQDKIAARLDAVCHLIPLQTRSAKKKANRSVKPKQKKLIGKRILLLAFDYEVQHGTASVRPSVQSKNDTVGGHFDELFGTGNSRLVAASSSVQDV